MDVATIVSTSRYVVEHDIFHLQDDTQAWYDHNGASLFGICEGALALASDRTSRGFHEVLYGRYRTVP